MFDIDHLILFISRIIKHITKYYQILCYQLCKGWNHFKFHVVKNGIDFKNWWKYMVMLNSWILCCNILYFLIILAFLINYIVLQEIEMICEMVISTNKLYKSTWKNLYYCKNWMNWLGKNYCLQHICYF